MPANIPTCTAVSTRELHCKLHCGDRKDWENVWYMYLWFLLGWVGGGLRDGCCGSVQTYSSYKNELYIQSRLFSVRFFFFCCVHGDKPKTRG